MTRQHAAPLLIPPTGEAIALAPLALGQDGHGWSEATVQSLIQAHPACLPIAEIDPLFAAPVPICTELNTNAGPIDNLLVTASGLPVLVECKLWRNPQARREVVGQILDYAKELSRWSSADLQREVRRRLGREGDPVLELVRAAGHEVDEIAFGDALTLNLRRGRFLLLIVGDGIREGVEAIAEYLQAHAGLHFTLGLVELPIFAMPDGARLVAPRVVARTALVRREVIAVPDGFTVNDADGERVSQPDPSRVAMSTEPEHFWKAFLDELRLDDPEQVVPRPAKQGYVVFMQPAPQGSCWITAYREMKNNEVGVSLSSSVGVGLEAVKRIAENWPELEQKLGGTAKMTERNGRPFINDHLKVRDLNDPAERARAFAWLRTRTNDFINVLRPLVRAAVTDLTGE